MFVYRLGKKLKKKKVIKKITNLNNLIYFINKEKKKIKRIFFYKFNCKNIKQQIFWKISKEIVNLVLKNIKI